MFSSKKETTRARGKSTTEPRIQLTVMGPGGVGKSCLVLRYVMNHYVEDYDPTIEDSYRKSVSVDNVQVILDIMDTAGQEEFSMLEDQWIRQGEGFMLVFDVMDDSTVEEVERKHAKIVRIKEEFDTIPLLLIGNKQDKMLEANLKSTPATEKAKALAQKWGCKYMEASAKMDKNVSACYDEGVRAVRKWRLGMEEVAPQNSKWCTLL